MNSQQRLWFNTLLGAAVIVLAVWSASSLFTENKSEAAWFNSSWQYRQAAAITNATGGTLTNYQITVTIDTASLITAGKLQSSCNDVRFVAQTGKILPYWRVPATACNTSTTKYIVRTSSIPTDGATIYFYYGNPSASDAQDASKVFDQGGLQQYFYAASTTTAPTTQATMDTFFQSSLSGLQGQQRTTTINCSNIASCNPFDPDHTSWATEIEGALYAPTAGTYTFAVDGDDAQELTIDDDFTASSSATTSVANYYNSHGLSNGWTHSGSLSLTKGFHTIRYRMTQGGGGYAYKAAWQKPGDAAIDYIPSNNFYSKQYVTSEPTVTFAGEESGPGPAAYWKFDEGAGTIAHDSTSNHDDGTITGATWASKDQCISGKCLSFDGSTSYITTSGIDLTSGDWTMSAWIYPTTYNASWKHIFGSENGGYAFGMDGSNNLRVTRTTVADASSSNYSPPLNTWTYVAATWVAASNTLTYYVNGNAIKTVTFAGSPTAGAKTKYIGRSPAYTSYWYGKIDEAMIYPYARSSTQIQTDYIARGSLSSTAVLGAKDQSSLSNGLVGYWKMDDNVSGDAKTLVDSSGNGNNATTHYGANTTGMDCTTIGKYGNGCTFDGVDDYADIPDSTSLSPTTAITLSTWIYGPLSTQIAAAGIIGKDTSTGINNQPYALYVSSAGTITFLINSSTNAATTITASGLSDNTWYHVVGTFDGKTMKLYVNGSLQTSAAKVDNIADSTGSLKIGQQKAGFNRWFSGTIDESRVYNRALSASEVSQLYTYAPTPIAYYTFEEGSGTTINDVSGTGNTATLTSSFTTGKYGGGLLATNNGKGAHTNGAVYFGNQSFTYEAWVKSADTDGSQSRIMGMNFTSGGYCYFNFGNGNIQGECKDSNNVGGALTAESSINIADNKWHHVTLVIDRGANKEYTYVDGVLGATNSTAYTGTFGVSGETAQFLMGYQTTSATLSLNGSLDEVKIYNYARTSGQIIQDMNASHPLGGSPVGSEALWLKLDEGYGTTAHNSGTTGSGFNGTLSNTTWTNGIFGKAISVSGVSGNGITVSDSGNSILPPGNGAFTISLWVNPTNLTTTTVKSIMQNETYTVSGFRFGTNSTGKPVYWSTESGGTLTLTSNTALTTGQWYQLIVSYDGTNGVMYLNGKQVATGTGTVLSNTNNIRIGSEIGGKDPWNGLYDDVKIYQAALTADDIKIDYNHNASLSMGAVGTDSSGNPSNASDRAYCPPGDNTGTCGPIAQYSFEEKSGSTVQDSSGNGNTGTINGSPAWVQGKIGTGMNFQASTDYISTTGIVVGSTWTISTWSKFPLATTGSYRTLARTGTNLHHVLVDSSGNLGTFNSSFASSGYNVNSLSGWHYLTAIGNGGTTTFYIDGRLVGTSSQQLTGNITQVGGIGSNQYWGTIDEFRVYNYARTPAQIAWDYNRGAPVAHYKFDECQGSTVRSSGDTYDPSLNGTIIVGGTGSQTSIGTCQTSGTAWGNGASGKYNSSLNFDGTDDYVNIGQPTTLQLTGSLSISAWVKTTETDQGGIVSHWYNTTGNRGYRLFLNNGAINWNLSSDGTASFTCVSATGVANTGTWQLVTATLDTSTGNAYVYANGKLVKSCSGAPTVIFNPTQNVNIDTSDAGTTGVNTLTGQIDDVQIFNYALTTQQVKSLYNNSSAIYFGP